ncbi:N-acetylmuramoyl-L-alanine amidase [Vagococcus vulneris]|uniref:N-acetylmuramoyl-L-alanine amidase domain-containing protein n=1 Tax=Vagococcus vulneris TaxID=1977869 RepID=A0A429ZWT3_9ENTE|nr:N-acetylmuramoyl-L-alanine amidase [Vagococcus vulneris]RST98253.1 hypothetical protein CBF37_08030 [Vagococcus vulneris]
MGYSVDKRFMLAANEGDSRKAQNYFIICHETANSRATGENEATYMKRAWRNAYTTHIVGDGKVYLIGEPGYVSWGALDANPYAPAQIELQHTLDKNLFKKNYAIYIELIRDLCNQFGIPKQLDASGKWTKGVKSHEWCSYNFGGDHTDPFGYLAKMGVSRQQFAKDVANGVSGGGSTVKVRDDYYSEGSYFEALQDLQTYYPDWKNVDKTVLLKKGTRFPVRNIQVTPAGTTHAYVAGLTGTVVTLAKSHVKRV